MAEENGSFLDWLVTGALDRTPRRFFQARFDRLGLQRPDFIERPAVEWSQEDIEEALAQIRAAEVGNAVESASNQNPDLAGLSEPSKSRLNESVVNELPNPDQGVVTASDIVHAASAAVDSIPEIHDSKKPEAKMALVGTLADSVGIVRQFAPEDRAWVATLLSLDESLSLQKELADQQIANAKALGDGQIQSAQILADNQIQAAKSLARQSLWPSWALAIATGALVGATIFLVLATFHLGSKSSGPPATSPPMKTSVPLVANANLSSALKVLQGAHFRVAVNYEPSNTVPVGGVMSQQPMVGSMLAPGATVTITLSEGPSTVRAG